MRYRWVIANIDPEIISLLMESVPGLNDQSGAILAQCLINRGLTTPETARAFLNPRLNNLSDPFLLPDMENAVDRTLIAIEKQETVLIIGDYDVDGLAATAIIKEVLSFFGLQVEHFIPRRIEEGYGLTPVTAQKCFATFKPSLIIAVDCGSTSTEAIQWLKELHVDVIVIDHHNVQSNRSTSFALVNPHRHVTETNTTESVPFTELCSAALAFKFCHALVKKARQLHIPKAFEIDLKTLLDLVALATISDAVPLIRENRIFSKAGLLLLNKSTRPGLQALRKVAQAPDELDTWDVAFLLAPRLNAAGRLNTADEALELLSTRDPVRAQTIAEKLDSQNRQRQEIEKQIMDCALARLKSHFDPKVHYAIVLGDETWHIGVIGIVAAKILQQFYRPTIIMGGAGACWRGSARSVPGFDLVRALQKCSHLLIGFGGHAAAAGISIDPEKTDLFAQKFNVIAAEQLSSEALTPVLELDGEITLRDVTTELAKKLLQLKPWGIGNPQPKFLIRGLTHAYPPRRVGPDGKHLRAWLTDGHYVCPAVWWDAGNESLPTGPIDIAATVTVNHYEGKTTAELELIDWRPAMAE